MELKVWVEGIQRVVCGVAQRTTCQDVIIALAQATGKTGRFSLAEKWRESERVLSPTECPILVLEKYGEYSADVQFVLYRSSDDAKRHSGRRRTEDSQRHSGRRRKEKTYRDFTPPIGEIEARSSYNKNIRRNLTFSGAHRSVNRKLIGDNDSLESLEESSHSSASPYASFQGSNYATPADGARNFKGNDIVPKHSPYSSIDEQYGMRSRSSDRSTPSGTSTPMNSLDRQRLKHPSAPSSVQQQSQMHNESNLQRNRNVSYLHDSSPKQSKPSLQRTYSPIQSKSVLQRTPSPNQSKYVLQRTSSPLRGNYNSVSQTTSSSPNQSKSVLHRSASPYSQSNSVLHRPSSPAVNIIHHRKNEDSDSAIDVAEDRLLSAIESPGSKYGIADDHWLRNGGQDLADDRISAINGKCMKDIDNNDVDINKKMDLVKLVNLQIEKLQGQDEHIKKLETDILKLEENGILTDADASGLIRQIQLESQDLEQQDETMESEIQELEIVSWVDKLEIESRKHGNISQHIGQLKVKMGTIEQGVKLNHDKIESLEKDLVTERQSVESVQLRKLKEEKRLQDEVSDMRKQIEEFQSKIDTKKGNEEKLLKEIEKIDEDIKERQKQIEENEKDLKQVNLENFSTSKPLIIDGGFTRSSSSRPSSAKKSILNTIVAKSSDTPEWV